VLLQLLGKYQDEKCVALVGHEPVLSELISRLMGASEHSIGFAKGAVAVLEIKNAQPLRGELQAFVSPCTVLNRLKKRR
jgi:phosphohistidine phosphatase SixA